MASTIAVSAFEGGLEAYVTLMVETFNHQPSGMAAARRDLGLLCDFLHQHGLQHLDAETLLQFFATLRRERANQPDSLNRKISSIKSYLRYLRLRQVEGAQAFPIESLKRARQPYPGPIEALSVVEVTRLLGRQDQGSVLGVRNFVLFTLLYRLGLRLGEALALDLGDLDLDGEVLHIHGKGRRARTLPLLADLADLLRRWLLLRGRLFRARTNTALFLSKKGNRLSLRAAEESFASLVARAGPFRLRKVTPHSLRHAFATHAMEGEADLLVLKAALGHAWLKSTEIYLHPSLKVLRQAINDHPASEVLAELMAEDRIVLRIQPERRRAA